jgi:hypothetical protein
LQGLRKRCYICGTFSVFIVEVLDSTLSREFTMADQKQPQNASKKDADKKQPETVLLTAEELRAIAGGSGSGGITGAGTGSGNPTPKTPTKPGQ